MRRAAVVLGLAFLLCACARQDALYPVTREEGSGTRAAFGACFDLAEEEVSLEAIVTNSTSVVRSCVAGNPNAIGYLSLNALDGSVRALAIDGVMPSEASIADGSYPVLRTFYFVASDPPDASAAAFLRWLCGETGKAATAEAGFLPADFTPPAGEGEEVVRLTLSGSSSVAPLADALRLAYLAGHPGAQIEVQQSDSSTGAAALAAGICQLAMLSRAPGAEEGVAYSIALDALAVVVAPDCPVRALSRADVRAIFSGKAVIWDAFLHNAR